MKKNLGVMEFYHSHDRSLGKARGEREMAAWGKESA